MRANVSKVHREEALMWLSTVGLIVTLSLLLAPLPVHAQLPRKAYRIGVLAQGPPPAETEWQRSPFVQGLRELGWVEGQNIRFERRYAAGRVERLPELAVELVRLPVDVIVTAFDAPILAAKRATTTIPIVFAAHDDPIGTELVASLAQPGGTITGISTMGSDLSGKRLALLKEIAPTVSRVAVLWNATDRAMGLKFRETRVAAQQLGVPLQSVEVRSSDDLDDAFAAMTRERPDALMVLVGAITGNANDRARIADFAAQQGLPAIYETKSFVDAGGLMSYGPSLSDNFRRAAYYVDRILKGAKPADIPVEQPMKFAFIINLKTARALGLTIPPTLLFQADEVIQ